MFASILIPFLTVGLAEFLDKSQISLLLLATRTKRPFLLFLGAMLGFLLVDGLAVLIGSFITTVIPHEILKIITSVLLILFGILTLRSIKHQPTTKADPRHPFITGLTAILLVEWGDKTQLATAVFATQYQPIFVLIGVLAALSLLSALAIFVGSSLASRFNKQKINLIAGIAFILIGILFFFS